MARKKKDLGYENGQLRDDLAGTLADTLNKKFSDVKVAYFLDGTEETPTDLTEWISTGSSYSTLQYPTDLMAVFLLVELPK